jgi:osmoprotectant transport system permease protein
MRPEVATKLGITSLDQLGAAASTLSFGADYELLSRREWASARDAYHLEFAHTASFDPSFLYEALRRGEVDVISAFSSDGRIAADHLVVLGDPAGAFPPYDAMLLLGPRAAGDARVVCVLSDLRGRINVDLMRQANDMVDRVDNKQTPAAAAAWLLAAAHVPPPHC